MQSMHVLNVTWKRLTGYALAEMRSYPQANYHLTYSTNCHLTPLCKLPCYCLLSKLPFYLLQTAILPSLRATILPSSYQVLLSLFSKLPLTLSLQATILLSPFVTTMLPFALHTATLPTSPNYHLILPSRTTIFALFQATILEVPVA